MKKASAQRDGNNTVLAVTMEPGDDPMKLPVYVQEQMELHPYPLHFEVKTVSGAKHSFGVTTDDDWTSFLLGWSLRWDLRPGTAPMAVEPVESEAVAKVEEPMPVPLMKLLESVEANCTTLTRDSGYSWMNKAYSLGYVKDGAVLTRAGGEALAAAILAYKEAARKELEAEFPSLRTEA